MKLLFCFVMTIFGLQAMALPVVVDVYKTSDMAMTNSPQYYKLPAGTIVNVHNLDTMQKLTDNVNQYFKAHANLFNLKETEEKAKVILSRHQGEIHQYTQDIMDFFKTGLRRLPAVVINHRYAVLGTTDVGLAYDVVVVKEQKK